MKLLHLDASALGSNSVSREVSAAIVKNLRSKDPGIEVAYRDLAAEPLSHWLPHADAGSEAALFDQAVLQEFLDADVVVIGAPMYNFTISSQLKAWVDRILVAGKTFKYGATGPEGLCDGKRVIVASARGGVYSEGPAAVMDFQEPYLRTVFAFIGIHAVEFIRAEGVAMGDEAKSSALKSAHAAAASISHKAA